MVNIKELRIGNYVASPSADTTQWLVLCSKRDHIKFYFINLMAFPIIGLIETIGIPITKDILALTNLKGSDCLELVNGNETISFDHLLKMDSNGKITFLGKEIKYVHQLQNLIFALTDTELEINIKALPSYKPEITSN